MKKSYLWAFCWASSMGFAQQGDSISIALQQVSIHIQQSEKNKAGSVIHHQEVFQEQPAIKLVQRSAYAIDPSFRANQYEQLNIQLDGAIKAMNACPNRMDPITTHFALNQIESVELIKGPFSMRFGPTFGGIVNLVSKQIPDNQGLDVALQSAYQSNALAFTDQVQVSWSNQKWSGLGGYNYQKYGDYKDGDGTKVPSHFRSQDYYLKFALHMQNHSRYEVGFQQQFGRDIAHPTLPMDTSFDDTSIFHYLGTTQIQRGALKEIQSKAYLSLIQHQMHNFNRPNAKMMHMITDVESVTAGVKIEALWRGKNWKAFTGVDGIVIQRDGLKKVTNLMQNGQLVTYPKTVATSVWQDAYQENWGVFMQGLWNVSPRQQLEFGTRLDYNELRIKDPSAVFLALYPKLSASDLNWSGMLSYLYRFQPNHTLKFMMGRGVRSGDMIERSINQHPVGMDGIDYIGNPLLKPEVNYQLELNTVHQFPLGLAWMQQFSFELSAYYSFLKDYIVAEAVVLDLNDKPTMVKQFTNISHGYKTGFELNWSLDLTMHFSVGGFSNYIFTRNVDWNEAIALTPPFENRVHARYQNSWMKAQFEHQFVDHQNQVATSFQEMQSSSYHLLHFSSQFSLSPQCELIFGIDNLLNTYYQSHLNFNYRNQADLPNMLRMSNPGRNFKVMVKYNF